MLSKTWWLAVLVAVGIGTPAVFAAEQEHGEENSQIEGSWYVTVHVTEPPNLPDYDALYAFATGGVFTRIDGRNNAPGVGTWKHTSGHHIVFSSFLFNFAPDALPSPATRNGAILAVLDASVIDGKMTGTFEGFGVLGLNGFFRAGTFTGTRISPEGNFQ
jgi:hypothetical protein